MSASHRLRPTYVLCSERRDVPFSGPVRRNKRRARGRVLGGYIRASRCRVC
jgi:hypothetical protein